MTDKLGKFKKLTHNQPKIVPGPPIDPHHVDHIIDESSKEALQLISTQKALLQEHPQADSSRFQELWITVAVPKAYCILECFL